MMDIMYIGSTPSDEECAQVGSENYASRARAECTRYIAQLRRVYGEEPNGAVLRIKACPHDFGTYHEVVCSYETEMPEAVEYAYRVEEGCLNWDDK